MSKHNKLSENDQLIKELRSKNTDNPKLKKAIDDKLKVLERNKTVIK
jgi:hypothetical protein